ncbi:MAG: DUF4389 domain-containing protein [Gaiellaceae bacterium]
MEARPPVRLVVTDDLQRSRLTVGFRLFLAIPHFLWLGLFGMVVFVVVLISWFVTLFAGRSPEGFHDLLAKYIRYATRVEAYLFVAANPYPGFLLVNDDPYPVDVEIDPPAPQRRLVTLFRLFLAFPAILLWLAFSGGSVGAGGGYRIFGGVAVTAAFLAWFASLARGRCPRGLRDVIVWSLGYSAQVLAYLFLLTDRYPHTGPDLRGVGPPPLDPDRRLRLLEEIREREPQLTLDEALVRIEGASADVPDLPARLLVADDLRRSRLTVLFRLLLAFPHIFWILLWTVLAIVVAVLNWFATLALGRSPRPFARFLSAYVRYGTHLSAFLYLVGNPFPGFVGKAGSYPVDLELEPFARQHRIVTGFRFLLAFPALLLSSAVGSVAFLTALLGWFVCLVRGRMPVGLRDAGAYALGYTAQVSAYVFLLSDRYPYSGPLPFAPAAEPPAAALPATVDPV